jgi:hypothetical protein
MERVHELVTPWDPGAPLAERVDALLDRRRRIYTEGAQVRLAALVQEPFSPALQEALEFARRASRAEIDAVFAPELAAVPDAERPRLRAALEVATGSATWDQLTSHPDLAANGEPDDEALALVRDLVHAALAAWGRPSRTAEPG